MSFCLVTLGVPPQVKWIIEPDNFDLGIGVWDRLSIDDCGPVLWDGDTEEDAGLGAGYQLSNLDMLSLKYLLDMLVSGFHGRYESGLGIIST